jgi:hypothetical protein
VEEDHLACQIFSREPWAKTKHTLDLELAVIPCEPITSACIRLFFGLTVSKGVSAFGKKNESHFLFNC